MVVPKQGGDGSQPRRRRGNGKGGDNVRPFPRVVARNESSTPPDKLLPQNIEAESAVLGSVLIDPDAMTEAARILAPGDFYRDAHRVIFGAALDMLKAGMPVDLITLCDELARIEKLEEVGGASYVSSLSNQVPTSANVAHYAAIVKRCATLRAAIHYAGQVAALAYSAEGDAAAVIGQAEALMRDVRAGARLDDEYPLLTLDEVWKLPMPEWLIGDTLQQDSVALVYAKSQAGKSFLVLDMGLHVAAGLAWRGLRTVSGPVVYVAAEGARGIGMRARAWCLVHGLDDVPDFYVMPKAVQLLDVAAVTSFCARVEAMSSKPVAVIVDTVGRSMAGGSENENDDVHALIGSADLVRRATGATVVLVHHSGKDEGRGARGGSAFEADTDTVLHLVRDGDVTTVYTDKQKDGEKAEPWCFGLKRIALDENATRTSCVIEPTDERPSPAPARLDEPTEQHMTMLSALIGWPEGMSFEHWLLASDMSRSTFNRRLKEAMASGWVTQVNKLYHLTPDGQHAAEG